MTVTFSGPAGMPRIMQYMKQVPGETSELLSHHRPNQQSSSLNPLKNSVRAKRRRTTKTLCGDQHHTHDHKKDSLHFSSNLIAVSNAFLFFDNSRFSFFPAFSARFAYSSMNGEKEGSFRRAGFGLPGSCLLVCSSLPCGLRLCRRRLRCTVIC